MRILPPYRAAGCVRAPSSKSDLHRLLILAALQNAPTRITNACLCGDTRATAACLTALGADISREGDSLLVRGIVPVDGVPTLCAGESGSTLRFLLPVTCALYDRARFDAAPSLKKRPIAQLLACMKAHGVTFSADTLPFETRGRLVRADIAVPADVSSQYTTGLMLASVVTGGSAVPVGTVNSEPYIQMTRRRIADFSRHPREIACEGDWSGAAYFLCLGAMSDDGVSVTGLNPRSEQGDRRILSLLRAFGANVTVGDGRITVRKHNLHGINVNLGDIPDLLAPLAVVAAFARGDSVFSNAARLRSKESDRLMAMASLIRGLGGSAEETEDGLVVRGKPPEGGSADSFGDHRIAMAAAIAACRCQKPVVLTGDEAVSKSFPDFFERLETLWT